MVFQISTRRLRTIKDLFSTNQMQALLSMARLRPALRLSHCGDLTPVSPSTVLRLGSRVSGFGSWTWDTGLWTGLKTNMWNCLFARFWHVTAVNKTSRQSSCLEETIFMKTESSFSKRLRFLKVLVGA